jgi:universal stress protein F
MVSRILVPLDVNVGKTSKEALALAYEMAKSHGAKLTLLHVIEQVPGYAAVHLPANFREKAVKTAEDALKATAKAEGLEGKAEMVVREGHPSTEILEYAQKGGFDMIVIASHDPGIADYLLGSVAARVVRHAHCSVLVVRT